MPILGAMNMAGYVRMLVRGEPVCKSVRFPVTVRGGMLQLDFRATNGLVAIAGIEIEK